jgi:hypothetical protein
VDPQLGSVLLFGACGTLVGVYKDRALALPLLNTARSSHDAALVFLGPKVMLEKDISREAPVQLGEPRYPVFYINYDLHPQADPWNVAIGRTVKFFRSFEYHRQLPA